MKKSSLEIRPALAAILISPDPVMREAILARCNTGTIRDGYRDYHEGQPVMLCCHVEPWAVMARIGQVRHCTLGKLKPEEYQQAGFPSMCEVLSGMKTHYPDIKRDSPVTFIGWHLLEGKLVDERSAREYAEFARRDGWEALIRQIGRAPVSQSEVAVILKMAQTGADEMIRYLEDDLIEWERGAGFRLTKMGKMLLEILDTSEAK